MIKYLTKKDYIDHFRKIVPPNKQNTKELEQCLVDQFNRLNDLNAKVMPENFWQTLLEVLGIDAKLSIITELAQYEEFSMEDILRIVETDYRSYYQELCGYGFKAQTKPSIIFNVV